MHDVTYIISCIPLSARDTPPPEQQNCKPIPCPECGSLMWMSEKKRKMMKMKSDCLLMCIPCVVNLRNEFYGDEEVGFQDDLKQVDDFLRENNIMV